MSESKMALTDFQRKLYRRNINLPQVGEAGQVKLLQGRVLVVGLGGLGSPALLYLAACGIGELGIVDGDRVELSNLQRQVLHGLEEIGEEKTVSAEKALRRIRPDIRLKLYPFRMTAENAPEIVSGYDFVIEATDNFESKFLINDVCVRMGKPFSHAGILGMFGQAMTVLPGRGPCFRCIFDDPPEPGAVKTTEEVGILGSTAGVFGAIQATEAVKYILGCGELLVGRLITWDALAMTFREVKLPQDKRCKICQDLSA